MSKHSIIFNGKCFDKSLESSERFYEEVKYLMDNYEYGIIIDSNDKILGVINGLEKNIITINHLISKEVLKDYKEKWDYLMNIKYAFSKKNDIDYIVHVTYNTVENDKTMILYAYLKYLLTFPDIIFLNGYSDTEKYDILETYIKMLDNRFNLGRKYKLKKYFKIV